MLSLFSMKRLSGLLVATLMLSVSAGDAAEQHINKVLPHLLDKDGKHTTAPSLFERDAYQNYLHNHPEEQSGIRYDVLWQSYISGEYELRLELRGRVYQGKIQEKTIRKQVTAGNSRQHWESIEFTGEDFKNFGKVVAWRVSLWRGDTMVAHDQSFLWE